MIEILDPAVDGARIAEVLARDSGLRTVDAWPTALPELAALDRFVAAPATWDPAAVEAASRYVVYPWRATVVRLPADEVFHRLRTARNRHLIDDDEQRVWSGAVVGVAGLSVGASALAVCSLTGARRFRLADPDTLGPTNLNRLAGSVCDLGEPKTTLATRRLLETDPYCSVTTFPDGYRPDVADAFLGDGDGRDGTAPLTVLVEEMDDLATKVDVRLQARERRIPVVMATDHGDDVLLDVERYDLDGSYPLFHGMAGDVSALAGDPSRRVRAAVDIVGTDLTPRMRYSMTQIGRSLPAIPQLGTASALAGAVVGLAARLIACGVDLASGRYRVDMDRVLLGPAATATSGWNELDEQGFLDALGRSE